MQNCQLFDTVILQVPFRAFSFQSFVSSDTSPWIIKKLGFWLGFSLRAVASVPGWWKNYSCRLCQAGSTSNCWGTCSRVVGVLGSFWQIQTNTETLAFHHKIAMRNIQRAGFYACLWSSSSKSWSCFSCYQVGDFFTFNLHFYWCLSLYGSCHFICCVGCICLLSEGLLEFGVCWHQIGSHFSILEVSQCLNNSEEFFEV